MAPRKKEKWVEDDPNFTLWRLFDHTRFMVARLREKELGQYGLTPEQTHILYILSHHEGPASINFIVGVTQRQHHSISTQIDRMTKQGLVSRNRTPEDARRYEVKITKKGQAILDKVPRTSITESLSCLTDKQKAEFRGMLKTLLEKAYELNEKPFKKNWGE
jgi:DNA-binding MarR family transcriptional regulator